MLDEFLKMRTDNNWRSFRNKSAIYNFIVGRIFISSDSFSTDILFDSLDFTQIWYRIKRNFKRFPIYGHLTKYVFLVGSDLPKLREIMRRLDFVAGVVMIGLPIQEIKLKGRGE